MFERQNKDLEKFIDLLISGVNALFQERGELVFSKPAEKQKRKIVEYNGRMRADGMEKFNQEPTYVAAINYYASAVDMQKKKALGVVIVYVEQTYIPKLMKLLQYPPIDDESDTAMQDSGGTLCNIIAGRIKSEISKAGYIELEMSHFVTYRNSAFAGVDFCFAEYDLYEVNFFIEGVKRMAIEFSLGTVPRR